MDTEYLIATAARAPSVHNTQPWLFRVAERELGQAIELRCDWRRQLSKDPDGREMVISCGAALYGLRLAIRGQGYYPVVTPFPDEEQVDLLASVAVGAPGPIRASERELLHAVPHRHTHRAPFEPGPLPPGLAADMGHDACIEGAELVFIDHEGLGQLAAIIEAADFELCLDSDARAEIRQWTRAADSSARDGVPAVAFQAAARHRPGYLAQRDFDLGRAIGHLPPDGAKAGPATTAVLLTPEDTREDWLVAGQAMHRLLLRAASRWAAASLFGQPLETGLRVQIAERLGLSGYPQMVMQFGNARTSRATARRPASELIVP
jgi:hypothetical protein